MPELLWSYVAALLYFSEIASCLAIADCFEEHSHDRLTRMLKGDWSGHTLLEITLLTLFQFSGGYLLIDDTVAEKPYSKLLEEGAWVYSSKQKKVVFGVPIVLLVWTNGLIRITLGYRLWKKGGPSKFDLALELLSYARNHLKCKPKFVIFDSWYPSKKVLKRIRDYGWYFVCQLKKNRKFQSKALKDYKKHPYWNAIGFLSGGIKVLVVRYRRKYYATNRLSMDPKEVLVLYKVRQQIEEVIKLLKGHLSLEGCQAGYKHTQKENLTKKEGVQEHHIGLCLTAFLILEGERLDQKISWRKLKRHLISRGLSLSIPSLERLRANA